MQKIQKIKNYIQFKTNLDSEFKNLEHEKGILFFFDDDFRFVHKKNLLISDKVDMHKQHTANLFEIQQLVDASKEKNIIYIHNHPRNNLYFSKTDIDNYYVLKHFEKKLKYSLLDFLVVNKECDSILSLEDTHEVDLDKRPLQIYIKQYYESSEVSKVTVISKNNEGLEFSRFSQEYPTSEKDKFKELMFENFGDMHVNITFMNINQEEEIWKKI